MSDAAASRRLLHTELLRLRLSRGLTQTQVAQAHEWSASKVHRIEKGYVSVSRLDLLALLTQYGVTDRDTVENLLELARSSRNQPMPFVAYRDVFSPEILRFLGYEATASWIGELELLVLPGLLQTSEYTRAWITEVHGLRDDTRVEMFVQSRLERQRVLDRPEPPDMLFIIDEVALIRTVGNGAVMKAQLDHLVEVARRPNVTVLVLPLSLGTHAGLRGPFVYLCFAAENDPDVLYMENRRGDSIFENDVAVTGVYRQLLTDLQLRASPPEELDIYVQRALDRL